MGREEDGKERRALVYTEFPVYIVDIHVYIRLCVYMVVRERKIAPFRG